MIDDSSLSNGWPMFTPLQLRTSTCKRIIRRQGVQFDQGFGLPKETAVLLGLRDQRGLTGLSAHLCHRLPEADPMPQLRKGSASHLGLAETLLRHRQERHSPSLYSMPV